MTKVLACACQPTTDGAKYQDKTYGKGMRVHNSLAHKSGEATKYRCTVCGNVRSE